MEGLKSKAVKSNSTCKCGKKVYAKGMCAPCYQKEYWKIYKSTYIRKSRSLKANKDKGFAVSLFFRKDTRLEPYSEQMVSAITNARNEWEAFGKIYDSYKEDFKDFDLAYKTVIEIESIDPLI